MWRLSERRGMRQPGRAKSIFAAAVMLRLRARYVSKTAILGCRAGRSGRKSKSRLNSKDLDRVWIALRSLGAVKAHVVRRRSRSWAFDS
jgi:hypothetical protein